jgi:hypothetical protein
MSNWIDTPTTGALRTELARSGPPRGQGGGGTPQPTTPRRRARRWWSPAPAGA